MRKRVHATLGGSCLALWAALLGGCDDRSERARAGSRGQERQETTRDAPLASSARALASSTEAQSPETRTRAPSPSAPRIACTAGAARRPQPLGSAPGSVVLVANDGAAVYAAAFDYNRRTTHLVRVNKDGSEWRVLASVSSPSAPHDGSLAPCAVPNSRSGVGRGR